LTRPPPPLTTSPYTPLFRSLAGRVRVEVVPTGDLRQRERGVEHRVVVEPAVRPVGGAGGGELLVEVDHPLLDPIAAGDVVGGVRDRKSTRLNSSHVKISYAV